MDSLLEPDRPGVKDRLLEPLCIHLLKFGVADRIRTGVFLLERQKFWAAKLQQLGGDCETRTRNAWLARPAGSKPVWGTKLMQGDWSPVPARPHKPYKRGFESRPCYQSWVLQDGYLRTSSPALIEIVSHIVESSKQGNN